MNLIIISLWGDFFCVLRLIRCFLLELLLTLYVITAVEFTFVAFSVLNLLGNSTRLWNATAITCEHIFLVLNPIHSLLQTHSGLFLWRFLWVLSCMCPAVPVFFFLYFNEFFFCYVLHVGTIQKTERKTKHLYIVG